MGDGDEAINLSPSFFVLRMPSGLASPILGCLLPARSLCPSGVVGSPRFACRLAGRGAGRALSCRRSVRCGLSLVARSPMSVGVAA